jgi:hypothetical protein
MQTYWLQPIRTVTPALIPKNTSTPTLRSTMLPRTLLDLDQVSFV